MEDDGFKLDVVTEKDLSINQVQIMVKQISLGLKLIHMNQLIHRDIKPDNILIETYNTKGDDS